MLTIHAEETVAARTAVEMVFRCSHLENKDIFSKSVSIQGAATCSQFISSYSSCFVFDIKIHNLRFLLQDPFLRISRIVETGASIPICKTEVVNNNLNPIWKPVCLSFQQFGSKVSLLSP